MSTEDFRSPMPNENQRDDANFEDTMRKVWRRFKWGFRVLMKLIDFLITFIFYLELNGYKLAAGGLPNLQILSYSEILSNLYDDNARMNERIELLQNELIQSKTKNTEIGDENVRMNQQIRSLQTELIQKKTEKSEIEDKYSNSLKSIRDLEETLRINELENIDALRRLSKIIEEKHRDNNPNIVDLNYQCRPTKLAEMLSELYDNEWMSAYSVIADKFTGEQSIVILLDIVMEAYEYCSLVVNGSWEILEQWYFNKDKPSCQQLKVMKWLKNNRRAGIAHKVPEQSKVFKKKLLDMCGNKSIKSLLCNEYVDNYVDKCIELCLLMTAFEPSVVMKCQDWKPCSQLMTEPDPTIENEGESLRPEEEIKGSDEAVIIPLKKFTNELYKEYTKRGQYMEYIVWPVMLLHEGGSTLAKGIAQGTNDKDGFGKFTWRVRK